MIFKNAHSESWIKVFDKNNHFMRVVVASRHVHPSIQRLTGLSHIWSYKTSSKKTKQISVVKNIKCLSSCPENAKLRLAVPKHPPTLKVKLSKSMYIQWPLIKCYNGNLLVYLHTCAETVHVNGERLLCMLMFQQILFYSIQHSSYM